jgi:rod shape-determining protein MreC
MARDNKRRSWLSMLMLSGICLVIGYRFFALSYHQMITRFSSYLVYPVLVVQHQIIDPLRARYQEKKSLQELEQMVEQLMEEYETTMIENIQLKAMLGHVYDIHELIDFKQRYDDPGAVIVQILVKHFSQQGHFFLVDAGSRQGICQDMVAVYKNCLVGRVIEVYPSYSKVRLVTDASCHIAACCASSRAPGIHKGINEERETTLQYVSHLDHASLDDLVLSSGEGLVFPQGFSLGRISVCEQTGLYQQITVKPQIDLRALRYCVLIAKNANA